MFATVGVEVIEGVGAEIVVGVLGAQDVVDGGEDAVGDGKEGAFRAAFAGQAAQLRAEVGLTGAGTRPGDLARMPAARHCPAAPCRSVILSHMCEIQTYGRSGLAPRPQRQGLVPGQWLLRQTVQHEKTRSDSLKDKAKEVKRRAISNGVLSA